MHQFAPAAAALLTLALAIAAPRAATADVLVEIGSGDSVTGSFLPAGEIEQYVVRLVEGSKLSVTVAGRKVHGSAPVPVLTMLDPDVATVSSPSIVVTKVGARVIGFIAPVSGAYTLRLTSSTAGDYSLKAKWTTPTSVTQTFNFGLTPTVDVPFHAPPGTLATVRIAALAFMPGFPRIERIRSADASFDVTFPPPATPGPAMSVKNTLLGGTSADFTLTVSEDGERGVALLTVALVPPKTKARKVDVTTRTLGADPLNNFAEGMVIGPGGGRCSADQFPGDPLLGASVDIPSAALAAAAVVVLGPATELAYDLPVQARGPAVYVGPRGTTFAADATVTLPFDAGAFDPSHTGLVVLARDDHGHVTTVPADTVAVNDAAGTVSFPAQRGGSYQVCGP